MPNQSGWRWCSACQGFFFTDQPNQGVCPSPRRAAPAGFLGGSQNSGHSGSESGHYMLSLGEDGPARQGGWRWCRKCQGLFYAGFPTQGICPAGDAHDGSASAHYALEVTDIEPAGQPGWRWCRKCEGFYFALNADQGVCPAGDAHDGSASARYVALWDTDTQIMPVQPAVMVRLGVPPLRLPVETGPAADPARTFNTPPTAPGTVYTAVDGQSHYFVPTAVLGKRFAQGATPAVFIRRRSAAPGGASVFADTLEVTFELQRPTQMPAAAQILPPGAQFAATVALHPPGAKSAIRFNQVQWSPPPDGVPGLAGRLTATLDVTATPGGLDEILTILQDGIGAWFEVQVPVQYWVQYEDPADRELPAAQRFSQAPASQVAQIGINDTVSERIEPGLVMDPPDPPIPPAPPAPPAPPRPELRTDTVTLSPADSLRAFFPLRDPANRPIYAMVDSTFSADPNAVWHATPEGDYFMEAPTPNQYYVVPHGYGLAFDPARGFPSMSVVLVPPADPAASSATSRVHVRFTLIPWLDGARAPTLRKHIGDYSGGAAVYPDLVIGGANPHFTLTALFDATQVSVLGSAGAGGAQDIDPTHGFELVLDCSISFYTLLAKLLSSGNGPGEVGLQGNVAFQLKTNPADSTVLVTQTVPVTIRLDRPANHPLTARIDNAAAAPGAAPTVAARTLHVTNAAPVDVRVDDLSAVMLQMGDLAYAVAAAPATLDRHAGLRVPAGGEVAITLTLPDAQPWDGVAVNFVNPVMQLDTAKILGQVQELASSAGLRSTIHLWSYQLKNPGLLTGDLAGLYGIQVHLQQGDGPILDATLTTDQPDQHVSLAFSLADLVAGLSPDQPTFRYQRLNLFAKKPPGEWSAWMTQTANAVLIAPAGL